MTHCRGSRWCIAGLAAAVLCGQQPAQDEGTAVFRSDVSMGRIDAQVLDRHLRAIGGLTAKDFSLTRDGEPIPIREFSYEQMPVDVLLLLDFSGSMKPHVERVAGAANRALTVLGPDDRVGIVTFTSGTKVRLKLEASRRVVEEKLDSLVRDGAFGGGTDINGALLESAEYLAKDARKDARRAIVIVTDDQARQVNSEKVLSALSEADAVLMALLAPVAFDALPGPGGTGRYPPGSVPPWPGRGGGWGGVILGPGPYPGGGGPYPGGGPPVGGPYPGGGAYESVSAGTAGIAEGTGGESFPVANASSLETTFTRIRQQYTMHFYLPEGPGRNDDYGLALDLNDRVRGRHRDAELRYRQVYLAGSVRRAFVKRVRPRAPEHVETATPPDADAAGLSAEAARRRPVSERTGPRVSIEPAVEKAGSATASEPVSRRRRPAISEPHGPRVITAPTEVPKPQEP